MIDLEKKVAIKPRFDLTKPNKQVQIKRKVSIKTKIAIMVIFSLLSLSGFTQTKVVIDSKGNYRTLAVNKAATSTPTGKTFTDSKGNKYPVMQSVNNKLYYLKTSKTGNVYKVYLNSK